MRHGWRFKLGRLIIKLLCWQHTKTPYSFFELAAPPLQWLT
jgi:hypothetical protein